MLTRVKLSATMLCWRQLDGSSLSCYCWAMWKTEQLVYLSIFLVEWNGPFMLRYSAIVCNWQITLSSLNAANLYYTVHAVTVSLCVFVYRFPIEVSLWNLRMHFRNLLMKFLHWDYWEPLILSNQTPLLKSPLMYSLFANTSRHMMMKIARGKRGLTPSILSEVSIGRQIAFLLLHLLWNLFIVRDSRVKFSLDNDLGEGQCYQLLEKYMDENMKRNKLMQQMFIR